MPGTVPEHSDRGSDWSKPVRPPSPARRASPSTLPSIAGSINLRGGRIDDVSLKNYRETVDPKSPNIVLFSPAGTQNPYYAEFGWVGAQPARLPNAEYRVDRRQRPR